MLVLPLTMWIIVGTMFALCYSVFEIILRSTKTITEINVIGWKNRFGYLGNSFSFDIIPQFKDWLYYHIQGTFLLSIFSFGLIIFAVWRGRKLANVRDPKKMDIVYFIMLYSLISPIWLAKSVYNTIRRRDASWR
jgi:ABC-type Fe3+-siderophore transport system permease subunit